MPDKKAPKVVREERRKLVAANLLSGLNYRDIAEALNVSVGTIANDVKIIMTRLQKDQVTEIEEWRALEIRKLDRLTNGIWKKGLEGDLNSIDRLIKLMERKAKLLGLDAPVEAEVSMKSTDVKTYSKAQLLEIINSGPHQPTKDGGSGTSGED